MCVCPFPDVQETYKMSSCVHSVWGLKNDFFLQEVEQACLEGT